MDHTTCYAKLPVRMYFTFGQWNFPGISYEREEKFSVEILRKSLKLRTILRGNSEKFSVEIQEKILGKFQKVSCENLKSPAGIPKNFLFWPSQPSLLIYTKKTNNKTPLLPVAISRRTFRVNFKEYTTETNDVRRKFGSKSSEVGKQFSEVAQTSIYFLTVGVQVSASVDRVSHTFVE